MAPGREHDASVTNQVQEVPAILCCAKTWRKKFQVIASRQTAAKRLLLVELHCRACNYVTA
jgi:hypothetical protein